MPIKYHRKLTWALFGKGDIAFAGCKEKFGEKRHYLSFQQCAPGEIGHEDTVGREFPMKDGWVPGTGGACVVLEFEKVESLDVVIEALVEHRAERFPDAPAASWDDS